jgi:DNA damage-binding protein 1
MALLLDTRGDFVLVGDLMMSLCVLKFNAIDSKLEDVAADSSDNHMTAMAILDDAHYLGAEDRYNLFIAQRHVEAMSDEVSAVFC